MKPVRCLSLAALSLLVGRLAPARESRPAKIVEAVSAADRARYPGQLQAAEEADLTFPVGGRLVELPVIEGQGGLAGDRVARLADELRAVSGVARVVRGRGVREPGPAGGAGSVDHHAGGAPLLLDPFFASMAVVIMSGLAFATVLTLVVMPVLYATLFGIRPPSGRSPSAETP